MNLRDLFPDAPVKRDQTQPTEAGYLPYNPDRPPTRKAVAAAMQPTEDDCTSMVDGGICKHCVNCHMVMGQKERPARMGESTRRSLAFMTPEQHQEKIEQAARMADEYLAQQEAATLPPMPPQPDPAATIEALNALTAAFHSVDARENAENAQRIAQLEQAVGGRVG